MTKSQDNMARDAAKAAALVQETADRTANALNIQFIQKDVAEIKLDIKTIAAQQITFIPKSEYDVNHEELQKQIDYLTKIIYIAIGISMAAEVALKFFIK